MAPTEGGLETGGYRLFCCVLAEFLNNQKCRIIVVSPFAILPRRRTNTFDFIVLLRKKDKKELWICKIRRDEGEYFTVTGNTRGCSRHFRGEDYTISEDGKGKRSILRKGAVPSVFQWTAKKRFRSTLASKGKRKGGTLELPRKKRPRQHFYHLGKLVF